MTITKQIIDEVVSNSIKSQLAPFKKSVNESFNTVENRLNTIEIKVDRLESKIDKLVDTVESFAGDVKKFDEEQTAHQKTAL